MLPECRLIFEQFFPAVLPPSLKPFPEGTGDPEQRMDTEEAEGPEQKPGHRPEGVIEIGIFILVVMGGMGQIAGEFAV